MIRETRRISEAMGQRVALLAAAILLIAISSAAIDVGFARAAGMLELQSPLPTSADLRGACLVGANEAWAVGSAGEILHTFDGGITWTRQASGTTLDLNAVCFLDAERGWAAGGAFAWTTNGGATWQIAPDLAAATYSVDFVDALTGWAVGGGGMTYRTLDGGQSWSAVPSGFENTLEDVDFVDASTGWVVGGDGGILKTSDGGLNWTAQESGTTAWLESVCFVSEDEGWAAGSSEVFHTTNAGAVWQLAGVAGNVTLQEIVFLDSQNGWAAGSDQQILRTSDGGATWTQQLAGGPLPLTRICMASDLARGIAVGLRGAIFTTSDGGATWVDRLNGSTSETDAIDVVDAERVWAANNRGEILSTADGGDTWRVHRLGSLGDGFNGIDFIDWRKGWAVNTDDRVYRTADGGETWDSSPLPSQSGVEYHDVDALDGEVLLVVGIDKLAQVSHVLRSSDGGLSFEAVPHPDVDRTYFAADFVNGTLGWAAGGLGSIIRTSDAGASWSVVRFGVGDDEFTDIAFADAANGWAVGRMGLVLHTTDGGDTWQYQYPGPAGFDEHILSVKAISATTAWVSGTNRFVARTRNAGAMWEVEDPAGLPGGSIPAIAFLDAGNGWLAGSNAVATGSIWRRSEESTTGVPDAAWPPAASPRLIAVFPNPARALVAFRFEISQARPAQIRVFDLTGRLVRAQEEHFAASGEADIWWDARDESGKAVAPGVYFYRIESEAYEAAGKITIVR